MSQTGGAQVLLVEDDVGIGRLLERGLTQESYAVDWVRDLKSATERIREADYDLVVLDRMLPDGDGADLCPAAGLHADGTRDIGRQTARFRCGGG